MPSTRSRDATRRPSAGRRIHVQKRDPGAYIGRLPERTPEPTPAGPPEGQGASNQDRDERQPQAIESR
jgi:hypothetical protein